MYRVTDEDSISETAIWPIFFSLTSSMLLKELPVFGVRVSVMFHLTCVHIIFSSVSVAEWPPFGK